MAAIRLPACHASSLQFGDLTDLAANGYKNCMGEALLRFGPFSVDATAHTLHRDGELLPVSQRAVALLVALSRAEGAPVTKDDLLSAAWPGLTVEEANLTVQMAALRKALGPRDDGQEWIVTVPRLGYRLLRSPAQTAAVEEKLPTLAVLPFENLSDDPDQDYFADGMVDELITALSRFRGFAVVARSSSFAYRHRAGDIRVVAGELGVGYLVEGSVRRGGDRLRLAAALIGGGDGSTLWAQSFEGRIDEVFAFQDRITSAVAALVAPRIFSAEVARTDHRKGGSFAAYDLRLRAIAALYRFTPEDNRQAIGWLEAALKIAPDNGPLKGLLCWALEMRHTFGWSPVGNDDIERCLALADEAVLQAEDDAFVLAQCGVAMLLVGQLHERGLLVTMRAVELNPNDVAVLGKAANAHFHSGDLDEAERLCHKVLAIHPHFEALGFLALVHCVRRQFSKAHDWAARCIAINPSFPAGYSAMAVACVHLGRLDDARHALAALRQLAPGLATGETIRPRDPRRYEPITEALQALRD